MSTSAASHRAPAVGRPLVGFVVGRYFALNPDKTPDFNGITRNIEEAVGWAIKLWQAGFLIVTPHLNTHHFEAKTKIDPDPLENEEHYRAFDRKLLAKGIDFVFATPNWQQSTGGRLEVQVANLLGIPVFESIAALQAWASGNPVYPHVTYNEVSEDARTFGSKKDMKIALVDGPFWAQNGADLDLPTIREYARRAEEAAIRLFNHKVGAFSPQLNASYTRLGCRVPDDRYHLLNDQLLERVADCVFAVDGWDGVPEVRARVSMAQQLGKPVFASLNELLAWRDGCKDYCTVRIG